MGNPTSYLRKTLTWEGKKLVAYTDGGNTISYAYNEDGLRLEKTVNGVKTEYYYNGSILIAMADGTNTQKFSYDSTGNVVSVNFNGTEYYYLRNAQGDIVKLIDSSGNTVVEYTYDSWGRIIATTGSLANTVGANQPFRYRGYVYDEETGWYYLQSRYYDPTTCRFISADVLLSTGQGVLGHNSFAYCNDNPGNMVDDEGSAPYFLTLDELREIHNMVRDLVAIQTFGVAIPKLSTEHYIRSDSQRGFIDVYCIGTNTYYEIKSAKTYAERSNRVQKQLKKYEDIFQFLDSNMMPGTMETITGCFDYHDKCHVTFNYVAPGLVVYECTPTTKEKSRSTSRAPSRQSRFNKVLLPSMGFGVGVGIGYGLVNGLMGSRHGGGLGYATKVLCFA